MEPILVNVPTACRMLGISKTTLYELMAGELPWCRIKSSRRIAVADLRAFAARKLEEAAGEVASAPAA